MIRLPMIIRIPSTAESWGSGKRYIASIGAEVGFLNDCTTMTRAPKPSILAATRVPLRGQSTPGLPSLSIVWSEPGSISGPNWLKAPTASNNHPVMTTSPHIRPVLAETGLFLFNSRAWLRFPQLCRTDRGAWLMPDARFPDNFPNAVNSEMSRPVGVLEECRAPTHAQ